MAPGIWQIAIVVVLALLLFGGRGKISSIMGDFARGITEFRKGLKDDEADDASEDDNSGQLGSDSQETSSRSSESEKTSS